MPPATLPMDIGRGPGAWMQIADHILDTDVESQEHSRGSASPQSACSSGPLAPEPPRPLARSCRWGSLHMEAKQPVVAKAGHARRQLPTAPCSLPSERLPPGWGVRRDAPRQDPEASATSDSAAQSESPSHRARHALLAREREVSASAVLPMGRGPRRSQPPAVGSGPLQASAGVRWLAAGARARTPSPPPPRQAVDSSALLAELQALALLRPVGWGPALPTAVPTSAPGAPAAAEALACKLIAALPAHIAVRSVSRVQCAGAATAAYAAVFASLGPERLLWHGTSWESVPNIVRHGFNRAYAFAGRHGSKLGKGTYFAEDPGYALRFCGRGAGGAPRALFLAGVLPGRVTWGRDGLLEPPADSSGVRYDSTADSPTCPRVLCAFRDFQALPLYLVEVG